MVRRIGRRVLNPSGHNPEPTRWISVAQAAGIVGLSERATRDWLRRYDVRTHGSRPLLVDEAELRRIVAEVRGSSGAAAQTAETPREPIDVSFRERHSGPAANAPLVPLSSLLAQSENWARQLRELAESYRDQGVALGRLEERAQTQEKEIAALEAEVARMRGELEAARTRQAGPPEVEEAPPEVAAEAPEAAPDVRRPWWRVWR